MEKLLKERASDFRIIVRQNQYTQNEEQIEEQIDTVCLFPHTVKSKHLSQTIKNNDRKSYQCDGIHWNICYTLRIDIF